MDAQSGEEVTRFFLLVDDGAAGCQKGRLAEGHYSYINSSSSDWNSAGSMPSGW